MGKENTTAINRTSRLRATAFNDSCGLQFVVREFHDQPRQLTCLVNGTAYILKFDTRRVASFRCQPLSQT